jgi:hypothetical protein
MHLSIEPLGAQLMLNELKHIYRQVHKRLEVDDIKG